jgi:hypothetical protein
VIKNFIYIFIILISLSSKCLTNCIVPSAPNKKPIRPKIPNCVNQSLGTHSCGENEIQNYYNKIDSFNLDIENYANKLKTYLENTNNYVNCEIKRLNSE